MKKNIILILFVFLTVNLLAQLRLIQDGNGKYGFINALGDTVVSAIYDYAEPFSEGLALVKKFKEYKLIDTLGNLWDLEKLNKIPGLRYDWGVYHSGMPVIIPIYECAYIDAYGKVVLQVPYRDAESFKNGKAKVYDKDKYTYINQYGIILGPWQTAPDEYRAVLFKNFYGYVNKNGRLMIDYQYRMAYDFHNGVAKVTPDMTNWALINESGQYISDFYDQIYDFDSITAIVEKSGYYSFITLDGKQLSSWYQDIQRLDRELYRVMYNDKYAIVKDGYQVTQWYEYIERYNDKYWLAKNGNQYAFLNNNGAYVVGWYDKLWTLKGYPNLVFVQKNDRYGFYNVSNFYISPLFDTLIFSEGIALVRQNGKYGFINQRGKNITDINFDHATAFNNGIATVEKDGKVAYINKYGDLIIDWIEKGIIVKSPPPGLFVVKVGRKYGFQTLNGRRVIPAQYDYAEQFSDGLALVKLYPRRMYIDTNGVLLPIKGNQKNPALRKDWGYKHTGKPLIVTKWDYLAYINTQGQEVIKLPEEITDAESFSEGKAKVYKGDFYNYIDKKGNLIADWKPVPDQYHVAVIGDKFGFIDKNNHIVIEPKYDYAYDFKDGLAKVQLNGKWTLINEEGKVVTQWFDEIQDFNENGIAIVKYNNKYALLNKQGKIISDWYDQIYPFVNGMARVRLGNRYSFITENGQQISKWFNDAEDFSDGLAKVKVGDKWGFIDKTGNFILQPQFDWATSFSNGVAKVRKNNKFTLVNKQGKQITDWFDQIYFFSDERAVVQKDGKWGYIDMNGHLVIPIIYDDAYAFTDGQAMVIKDGKAYLINKNGDVIQQIQ